MTTMCDVCPYCGLADVVDPTLPLDHHECRERLKASLDETRSKLAEAVEVLQFCRPHLRMSTTVTSGRAFREAVDKLLQRLDRALADAGRQP
jgi:hypothetical protein